MKRDPVDDKLGMAAIEPSVVAAGSKHVWSLRYTAGEKGLDWTGSMRLTIPYGFSPPQFVCVTDVGYLTATVEVPQDSPVEMEFLLPYPVTGELHKDYECPHGRYIFLRPVGGGLKPGDVVRIDYGRNPFYPSTGAWAPYFTCRFLFDVAIDATGSGEFRRVPGAPEVEVVGGEATRALVVVPSVMKAGARFDLKMVPEDRNANVAPGGLEGDVEVFRNWESVLVREEGLPGPASVELKAPAGEGVAFWQVSSGRGVAGESNPVLVTDAAPERVLLWGDLHGHTDASDGLGPPEEMFDFARNVSLLDFAATADHVGPMGEGDWERIQAATAEANVDGAFVALPGYEINGKHGERNVYYPAEGEGAYEHWREGREEESKRLEELLRAGKALMVLHCHGNPHGDFNPGIVRMLEICSIWGSFEFDGNPGMIVTGDDINGRNARELWKRGFRAGVTGGSDCHAGRPGRADWLRHVRGYRGGLTGVWAKEFTRASLWEALLERRCYGTTGGRIILEFALSGHVMGSEVESLDEAPRVTGRAIGSEPVASMTVVRDGEEVYHIAGSGEDESIDWTDEAAGRGPHYYYLRATLQGGERAWSSPVWIGEGA